MPQEHGIHYFSCSSGKESLPPGMKVFRYVSLHKPSDSRFVQKVATYSEADFDRLLERWNAEAQNWSFARVPREEPVGSVPWA